MSEDYYEIEKWQVMKGIGLCLSKVEKLLNDAEILVRGKKPDEYFEHAHALGIYSFGVEEFGKALFLKDYSKAGIDDKCQVPKWIFGKGNDRKKRAESHNLKFDKAMQRLPHSCRVLEIGYIITTSNSQAKTKTVSFGDKEYSVSITGAGSLIRFSHIDLFVKLGTFYVDWDEKNKQWNYELSTYDTELLDAIRSFKSSLKKFNRMLFS